MVWHTVPRFVQRIFPKRMWEGNPAGNQVYLTFDDGPVPGVTDFVLNELEKRGQKASFFMVGDNVRKHVALAKEVISAGHKIGNHTFNHLNGWKTSDSEYLSNVALCDSVFEEKLQVQTVLFRPPYGLVRSSQASVVLRTKQVVMWNVLTGDYDRSVSPAALMANSCRNTRPGSIILFHDQQKTKEILPQVLPGFLDFLEEKGFETSLL